MSEKINEINFFQNFKNGFNDKKFNQFWKNYQNIFDSSDNNNNAGSFSKLVVFNKKY